MKTIDSDELINLCEEQEAFLKNGESRKANRRHDKIRKTIKKWDYDTRKKELTNLSVHPNSNVRLWAATYLFDLDEELAVKTTQQVIDEENIISLLAELVLDSWKTGSLKT